MSTAQANARQAARIAELKQKVDAATAADAVAQKALQDAERKLAEALAANPPDAGKVSAARGEVEQAREKADEARENLQFLHKQFDSILSGRDDENALTRLILVGVQYGIFAVLAAIVLGFLMYGIFSNTLLPSISSTPSARGLITFLIAVVTVTIALILVLATVVSDSPDREKRFLHGKEILTALIGVLGTIVGFYFGNTGNGSGKTLDVAPGFLSNENPVAKEKVKLRSFVSGGRPPYSFDVHFTPGILAEIKGKSPDGLIDVELEIPAVTANTEVTYLLRVKDSDGNTGHFNSTEAQKKITLKAPPPAKAKEKDKKDEAK